MAKKLRLDLTASGWVVEPTLSRTEAEAILGNKVSDHAWSGVTKAFRHFGDGKDTLGAKDTGTQGSPQEWGKLQDRSVRDLNEALARIGAVRERYPFLFSVDLLNRRKRARSQSLSSELRDAWDTVFYAVTLIERTDPEFREVPSEAELKYRLAKQIVDCLEADEIDVRLSDGRALDQMNGVAEADLTPVERLISAMGIHNAETPDAFARWLRRAVGQEPL